MGMKVGTGRLKGTSLFLGGGGAGRDGSDWLVVLISVSAPYSVVLLCECLFLAWRREKYLIVQQEYVV